MLVRIIKEHFHVFVPGRETVFKVVKICECHIIRSEGTSIKVRLEKIYDYEL